VNNGYVEYHRKRDLLIPLLYSDEIDEQINRHYNTAKDIYAAFQRLIKENEAPAIIIADLLNKIEEKNQNPES
jgi:Cdc6-like AAA superfamily ATPase